MNKIILDKIIVALDTSNLEEALNIYKKIKDKIFSIKIGLEGWNSFGKVGIKKFNEMGSKNLMLDLKLKDIPQTIYKAVKALDGIQFGFLTIHGQGGRESIEKAKQAAQELKCKPKIMMVTILTSLSNNSLKEMGNNNTVNEQVESLAKIAKEMKVGVVCSGHEAKAVRKIIGPDLLIFTPGIRMSSDSKNDQQRVCTPLEAVKSGSDKIIMGRSLTEGNIEENLNQVATSIKI